MFCSAEELFAWVFSYKTVYFSLLKYIDIQGLRNVTDIDRYISAFSSFSKEDLGLYILYGIKKCWDLQWPSQKSELLAMDVAEIAKRNHKH